MYRFDQGLNWDWNDLQTKMVQMERVRMEMRKVA